MKKTGRRIPKKGQSVFVVTAHHRSRIAGQILSNIVYVIRSFPAALAATREVLKLDYDIRDVVCGITMELLKTGTLYRANHEIVPSGELPPNTIVHVGWRNGFYLEFTPAVAKRLGLDPAKLAAEQAFWASRN